MNKDIFENGQHKNLFTESSAGENNFFLHQNSFNVNSEISEPGGRLNDYDYNILKDEAYRDISNELLKLEYKISQLEKKINDTNRQIQAARDINDYNTIEYLNQRKIQIEKELKNTEEIYNQKNISTRISDGIFKLFSSKIKICFSRVISFIKTVFIKILFRDSYYLVELQQSLSKLENINKSVDELINLQTPYGENTVKYEQLSKYITKANTLQSRISKLIR